MELEIADGLIAAARTEAERSGEVLTFAVMDEGGNMVAFARMDGAGLAGIETAIGKAYTAVATGAPTAELFPLTQPGRPLFGFGTSVAAPRPLVPMPGGFPALRRPAGRRDRRRRGQRGHRSQDRRQRRRGRRTRRLMTCSPNTIREGK
ncbi:MAG: heme-binding protein [Solirubrobacterales bacterium]